MSRYQIRPTTVGALARGADYTVRDLGDSVAGYTDMLKKELGVSLRADAKETRWTQLHELGHVKNSLWTPETIVKYAKKQGIRLDVDDVRAAEDARNNELILRAVPDAHEGFEQTQQTKHTPGAYMAAHASPKVEQDNIRPHLDPATVERLDAVLARIRSARTRDLTTLKAVIPLAQVLYDIRTEQQQQQNGYRQPPNAEPSPLEKQPKPKGGKQEPKPQDNQQDSDDEQEDGSGAGQGDEDDDSDDDEQSGAGSDDESEDEDDEETGSGSGDDDDDPDDEDEQEQEHDDDDDEHEDADAADREALGKPNAHKGRPCTHEPSLPGFGTSREVWRIPEVIEPPLTHISQRGNNAVTSAESGPTIRWSSISRMYTDGAVFRRLKRRPGAVQRGTGLYDASGSMALTDKMLDGMIAAWPMATLAIYCGTGSHAKPKRAKIVIVARNGRRVATVENMRHENGVYTFTENTCDGPALLWLARQPGPRLWICDGYVTGNNAQRDPARLLEEECAAIMQAAGIVQIVGDETAQAAYQNTYYNRKKPTGNPSPLKATKTFTQARTKITMDEFVRILRQVEKGIYSKD